MSCSAGRPFGEFYCKLTTNGGKNKAIVSHSVGDRIVFDLKINHSHDFWWIVGHGGIGGLDFIRDSTFFPVLNRSIFVFNRDESLTGSSDFSICAVPTARVFTTAHL